MKIAPLTTSLVDALFPKVRQRVLGLIYEQPDKSFYTNEIIRQTDMGTGVVQRELEKLTAAGIITVQMIGKQKHYQANQSSPLFSELRSLILKTCGLADIISQALSLIQKKIQIAFIYGSIAKQEDTAKSDIDLLIISDTLSYSELFSLIEPLHERLGRVINPTFYTANEWSRKLNAKNNFISQVVKQPKIFLIGNDNELSQLGKSG